jgi:signal transduction histidine kinase/sugar phosphate isomerase/epimerase
MMKYAFQTIIWGARPTDYREILANIRECGYEGLEIAQAPAFLPPPGEMRELLDHYDLCLLSLCGGGLKDRVEYCREGGIESRYYYVERVDEGTLAYARREGITLALHPHVYNANIQEDAIKACLDKSAELLLIPDTAHLYLARIDFEGLIKEHYSRLASVHLKDWTGIYGRSFQQYARGFCLPGKGEVHPEKVLQYLQKKDFGGWVVVECDHAKTTPAEYVQQSRAWITENGGHFAAPRPPADASSLPAGRPTWLRSPAVSSLDISCQPKGKGCLYRDVFDHLWRDSLEEFGAGMLRSLCERLAGVRSAQIWEFSPPNQLLGLLGEYPAHSMTHSLYEAKDCPLGRATETKFLARITAGNDAGWFAGFTKASPCSEILVLPILNTYNANQVQLLVTFCCTEPMDPECQEFLIVFSDTISRAYQIALDDLCRTKALQIEQRLGGAQSYEGFLEAALKDIMRIMGCKGASIFLSDDERKRLLCASTSGLRWRYDIPIEKQYYTADDGSMTGRVWHSNEATLIYKPLGEHLPKSEETVVGKDLSLCLIVPIRDQSGESVGILRLRNRIAGRQMFSLSDMAIAESLCQAITPSLLTLQQTDRFRKTIDRTIHEIKMPLTAIRGAVQVMEEEIKSKHIRYNYDYIEDINSWLRLQEQQIRRIDFYRYKISGREEKLEPVIGPVWMLRDVLAPAKRHIEILLQERHYDRRRISDDGLFHIPQLYIDKAMFQQIFFNLLGNAVKYCFKDPKSFQVNIRSKREGNHLLIIFDDHGRGIPEGYEKVIFEPYVRGPGADRFNVSGDGLGLWIVKDLVEAHGGSVSVTHRAQPTQITIKLPNELTTPAWYMNRNTKG